MAGQESRSPGSALSRNVTRSRRAPAPAVRQMVVQEVFARPICRRARIPDGLSIGQAQIECGDDTLDVLFDAVRTRLDMRDRVPRAMRKLRHSHRSTNRGCGIRRQRDARYRVSPMCADPDPGAALCRSRVGTRSRQGAWSPAPKLGAAAHAWAARDRHLCPTATSSGAKPGRNRKANRRGRQGRRQPQISTDPRCDCDFHVRHARPPNADAHHAGEDSERAHAPRLEHRRHADTGKQPATELVSKIADQERCREVVPGPLRD